MRKNVAAGAISTLALAVAGAGLANGAIIYDTTAGNQLGENQSTNVMDDVVIPGGGPVTIQKINFGVENWDTNDEDVDALISVWDTLDLNATNYGTVNTVQLGTTYRHHLGNITAGTIVHTGLFNLPVAVNVPDGDFGVQIYIVKKDTTTAADSVAPLMTWGPGADPVVGQTSKAYWSDRNQDGTPFVGLDKTAPLTEGEYVNLYLQIDPVPEPTSVGLLTGVGGAILLARRRRHAKQA